MFGLGVQEILIILFVALLIFGPKRIPELAKSLGKGINEFKKASNEAKHHLEKSLEESEQASH